MELWRLSFGGNLNYDIIATPTGPRRWLSFNELFSDKVGLYQNLWGWIEFDREVEERDFEEHDEIFDGRMRLLPFGGFDYLQRFYAVAYDLERYRKGEILCYLHYLPDSVRNYDESLLHIASNLHGLFDTLYFSKDPFSHQDDEFEDEMIEALEPVKRDGTIGHRAYLKMRDLIAQQAAKTFGKDELARNKSFLA